MSRDSAAIEESSNLTARLCPWKRFHLAGVQFLDTPRDLEIPCLFDGRIHGIVETFTTGVMRLFYALSKINLWPNFWRSQIATAPISGAIKSYVVSSTLSKLSIGEVVRNVNQVSRLELPASGLQHVGFVHRGHGKPFHSSQIGANFK